MFTLQLQKGSTPEFQPTIFTNSYPIESASIHVREPMAQWLARRIPDPKVGGSNPSRLNVRGLMV